MDSLMSGMSGMGMDMGSDPMFRTYNQRLARGYWYIVVFVLACFLLVRGIDSYQFWMRLRIAKTRSIKYPTRPNNFLMQIYATCTAIGRGIVYPQLHLKNRWVSWFGPPSSGRILFLACYWAVIVFMMTSGAVIDDAYYYERIGFRNAWISVTKVPLVYLLASKSSLIGRVVGMSHERLNWLHRWVSRTLLVTVTVHGGFFMREWVRADFVELEIRMMPMVKYGIGAWAILVWTFITSLSPLRRMGHEVFVIQHIIAAGMFLWLLWVHVPSYAMYNILFAVGAISFDWILRLCLMFYQNIRLRKGKTCNGTKTIGHRMELQAVGSEITVITIQDVHLSWKSGQHLYLYVPYLGLLESHPFTIATSYKVAGKCQCSEIQLAVRAQKGISRRLHRYAAKTQGISNHCLTCFIAGPYGVPPRWEAYETLILISASTGASFALPVLESILNDTRSICTRRIRFLLVVRERSHVDYYVTRLDHALARAEALGIVLDVEIAVTGDERPLGDETSVDMVLETQQELSEKDVEDPKEGRSQQSHVLVKSITASKSSTSRQRPSDAARCCCNAEDKSSASTQRIAYSSGRPEVAKCIRDAVELTGGETAVAVCAGKSLVATVRNTVFELSDDRGVHKGTGAQGIFLHVEEYCF